MPHDTKNNSPSRRKFMLFGMTLLSGLSILQAGIFTRKRHETVKLLTQDGKLVEVDKRMLTGSRKKIAARELQNWIKRN